MNDIRQIAFTNELRFERPRAEVFEAFLESEKWFQVSYGGERLKGVVTERRVGGHIYEDWGDGAGMLYGTIGWWDPPAGYSEVSHMLGGGITLTHRYEFEEDGGATILRQRFSAFGPISDEMAAGIKWHGSLKTFEAQLRSWIERGEVTAPPEFSMG
ncbi:MAG: SRPBCC domain-containing protein [Actinobacteria bacterium]|nr:SRPBCC domain-containing protein [Actinomycetota bacterium]